VEPSIVSHEGGDAIGREHRYAVDQSQIDADAERGSKPQTPDRIRACGSGWRRDSHWSEPGWSHAVERQGGENRSQVRDRREKQSSGPEQRKRHAAGKLPLEETVESMTDDRHTPLAYAAATASRLPSRCRIFITRQIQ
jgi:hypothetical protein